jgi:hypothetical protein
MRNHINQWLIQNVVAAAIRAIQNNVQCHDDAQRYDLKRAINHPDFARCIK